MAALRDRAPIGSIKIINNTVQLIKCVKSMCLFLNGICSQTLLNIFNSIFFLNLDDGPH